MADHMLTTVDNPYNPFTQWTEWYAYDVEQEHYTPQYLARVVVYSEETSEADQDLAIEQAIDEICKENPLGIYRKATRNDGDREI